MADLTRTLARLRVPLGFTCALAIPFLVTPTPRSVMIGGVVALSGEGLRIWAAGHLNKSREVTSSGPYRWFAHPLYVGSSVMGVGLAIASASVWVAVLVAAYLAITITAAIRSEEAFLRKTFGAAYDEYRRGSRDTAGATRRFSLAQALVNREYRALVGVFLALLLLALKAAYDAGLL